MQGHRTTSVLTMFVACCPSLISDFSLRARCGHWRFSVVTSSALRFPPRSILVACCPSAQARLSAWADLTVSRRHGWREELQRSLLKTIQCVTAVCLGAHRLHSCFCASRLFTAWWPVPANVGSREDNQREPLILRMAKGGARPGWRTCLRGGLRFEQIFFLSGDVRFFFLSGDVRFAISSDLWRCVHRWTIGVPNLPLKLKRTKPLPCASLFCAVTCFHNFSLPPLCPSEP